MFYLGHNFIISKKIFTKYDLLFYDCIICNGTFWLNEDDLYYNNLIDIGGDYWILTKLTCSEFIIKKIIE